MSDECLAPIPGSKPRTAANASARTSKEYLQERLATDDAPAYLSRGGDALKAPDLIDLLQTAFTKLVGRLPAAES